jgi:CheY-like chemotaxis protein
MNGSSAPEVDRPISGRPFRALIVDNDADAAETLAVLLGLWGHEFLLARDVDAALSAVRGYRPNSVFLDTGMPDLDVAAAARRLRARAVGAKPMLVAITESPLERGHSPRWAGFDACLARPFDFGALELLLGRREWPAMPALRTPPGVAGEAAA